MRTIDGRTGPVARRMAAIIAVLSLLLALAFYLGLSVGSTGSDLTAPLAGLLGGEQADPTLATIIWRIRFPRAILAVLLGAALSLGGLVFQAILRNPLAEPYILGVSGGAAIGAIAGILMGLARFPGVSLTAFAGSMGTLLVLLLISGGRAGMQKDALLLSGVMVNAFCSAVIMFLISLTQDGRLHNILFWLMGDFSQPDTGQALTLALIAAPCFVLIFAHSHTMNLLLMGHETARSMGVNVRAAILMLLAATSLMVSATVSYCGLVGFVGLVIPHMLRMVLGDDHRLLVPGCLLGGGTYLVLCDILARVLPRQGEMPVGVITALIGAPLFIFLLKRTNR